MKLLQAELALEHIVDINCLSEEDNFLIYSVNTINYKDIDGDLSLSCMLQFDDNFLSIETEGLMLEGDDVTVDLVEELNLEVLRTLNLKGISLGSFSLINDKVVGRSVTPLDKNSKITNDKILFMATNLLYMVDSIMPNVVSPWFKGNGVFFEDKMEDDDIELNAEAEKVSMYLKEIKDSLDSTLI